MPDINAIAGLFSGVATLVTAVAGFLALVLPLVSDRAKDRAVELAKAKRKRG